MTRLQGSLWEGVALRRTRAAADPDAPARPVLLPASWEEESAQAVAALLPPGAGPASLPRAAEAWIGRVAARGLAAGILASPEEVRHLAEALRALLLTRRGAPGASTWRDGEAKGEAPRFVLSLPAFLEEEGGFDAEGFAEACAIGIRTLDALGGGLAARLRLGLADLAGLLAGLGLAYESPEARDVAAAIAALARGAAEAESGRLAERLGARAPLALLAPPPPAATVVPGLAAAARAALDAAAASPQGLRHAALLVLTPPDAAEALLGAETGGIAPAPGPTRAILDPEGEGMLEVPTRAARRLGAPDRIARLLPVLVPEAARAAMRDAVAPFLHAAPPAPVALPEAPRPAVPGPAARPSPGDTILVAIGGMRVALHRAVEEEGGRLAGIAFTLPREANAATRGLMEGIAAAVSLGLAHGVPLTRYVDSFAYARIGPAGGVVEGDPEIRRASSVLDWAFRRLALDHLGRRDLPDPEAAESGGAFQQGASPAAAPLLPMELPRHPFPGGASAPRGPAPTEPAMRSGGGAASAAPRRRPGRLRLAG